MRANCKYPTDLEILCKAMKVKLYNIRQRNVNFKELQPSGKKNNSSNVNKIIWKDIQSDQITVEFLQNIIQPFKNHELQGWRDGWGGKEHLLLFRQTSVLRAHDCLHPLLQRS